MLEIMTRVDGLNPQAIQETCDRVRKTWSFSKPPSAGTIETGSKFYLALK